MQPSQLAQADLSNMELREIEALFVNLMAKERKHEEEIQGFKAEIRRLNELVAILEAKCTKTKSIPRRRVKEDENEGSQTALVVFKPPTEEERQLRRLSIDFEENFIDPSDAPQRVTRAITGMINKVEWESLAVSYIDMIKASSGNVRREVEEWFGANFKADSSSSTIVEAARNSFKTCTVELAVKLRPMVKMFRIGLGVRLGVVALSSYFDIITDLLVTIVHFNSGETVW